MATTRDIQEIINLLSADKAKSLDEGIKLLNSWLEGERSIGFCRLLGRNTARIKPDEIPHAETWPFLVILLTKCISKEISTNKKRQPKLVRAEAMAKTLRNCIRCAEDPKLSGKELLLLSVVKLIFNHIWDVMKDVPSFQSVYSVILRNLLAVKEYRYQMRKRVYCSLVLLCIGNVHIGVESNIQSNEVFRSILTLHVLLENTPGDFPDDIREDLVKEFCGVLSNIRDEGKLSCKLMECVNTFLLKDGPNLGCQAIEIHSAVKEFMFRCWLTTHDRSLKSSFILYAKLQLKLNRSTLESSSLTEQFFDTIVKELDQNPISCTGMLRSDVSRDDKVGNLGSVQQGLLELAAAVFYQACKNTMNTSYQVKRLKIEPAAARIRDGITKGSCFWNGAFCFLVHNYSSRIEKSLLVYWFEGICESLERIVNSSNTANSYDSLLWLLRALQELSLVLIFPLPEKPLQRSFFTTDEVLRARNGWNVIWSSLMHGLPIFSNVTPVVDAALTLLGSMILRNQTGVADVPQDTWDLRIFKHMPSSSVLYFLTCYFSWKGVQGDLRDLLHLRRGLLRAVLEITKEANFLNEHTVKLIPAAIFSLSTGSSPFLHSSGGMSVFTESSMDWIKEDGDHGLLCDVMEYSVEFLVEIENQSTDEVKSQLHRGIRLPRQIRQQLTHEIEEYVTGLVTSNLEFEKIILPDIINFCSLLCNCIYGSLLTRLREEKSSFFTRMLDCVLKLLELVVSVVEERCNEIQNRAYQGFVSILDPSGSAVCSLRSFISCPLFSLWKEKKGSHSEQQREVIRSVETLIQGLAKLFVVLSSTTTTTKHVSMTDPQKLPASSLISESSSNVEWNLQIVDVELDADDGSMDADTLIATGIKNQVNPSSPLQWKLELVSAISIFFSVSPLLTWDVLHDLMRKEDDIKVCEAILYSLCKCFPVSAGSFSTMISSINYMMLKTSSPKLCYLNALIAIRALLSTLLAYNRKPVSAQSCMEEIVSEENLNTLSDLVNKVAETGLPDWLDRINMIDCICSFVLLEPHIGQTMVERLLAMLQDTDYRVRLFLSKRINILFQTWDGHNELFDEICSNFGFEMVRASKDKLVKAGDVSASGDWHVLSMETALITLGHLASCSEKVETEAVFMMCVVAAIEPLQRKLTYAILDTLSRKLQYANRIKYLDELIGSILTCWVTCEVSLAALVEVQDLFQIKCEAKLFMQYCCPWLLPHLILREDIRNLNWVSKIACRTLPTLVKEYFVPIFAMCMAMHCSMNPDKERGRRALHDSIIHVAKISEVERDDLIKKNMVSIISCLLSLTSSKEPSLPFFSKDTVVLSVQSIVDGFLDMDDRPTNVGIIDKINVFRPDRVFKFLLEMHYQITTAIHPRHKCHRLAGIEALVLIIGYRSAVPSTSNYIFNIVGQLIGIQPLQEQCSVIISQLLETFNSNMKKEAATVLGEQLQFLVSKLVACCVSSVNHGETTVVYSSRVIALLHQLTIEADPSLHEYIRELEPFPDLRCLDSIRIFHDELCKAYSPRDHFLKFVRRTCCLPRVLLWSLGTLKKKLLMGDIIKREISGDNLWNCDPEVVSAVWTLVSLCGSTEADDLCGLLADFLSRVGIGDPYRVVFQLPKDFSQKYNFLPYCNGSCTEPSSCTDTTVPDELLSNLLLLFKKYLLDDSVKAVDITSQTLRGILSTERGQGALLSLNSYERSLLEIHSKGVNLELVEKLVFDSDKSSSEAISLDDSSLWKTVSKTYEVWVCSLVHSLIGHCDDIILRLCKDIVLLKAEVAGLLFANVLMDLAKKIDTNLNLCQLISTKVLENVFIESNDMDKSIHLFLGALSKLRSFYFLEKAGSFSTSVAVKVQHGRSSSYAKNRNTPEKSIRSANVLFSSSSWRKVYWLSIDYLVVAKAAIRCGSYFTAVMYVEHWCEEHFGGLTLGNPDFSPLETLPPHIGLLVAAFTQINEPDSIYGVIWSHKLTSQIITYEHEGNWSKALEYYDLLVRSEAMGHADTSSGKLLPVDSSTSYQDQIKMVNWNPHKGLIRSLQKTGCTHVLDVYCQGLTSQKDPLQHDLEFTELQYEAAWRAGNWDFSFLTPEVNFPNFRKYNGRNHFNENLHNCLRALQEGDNSEFHMKLLDSKKELVLSVSEASNESTEYIYSTIVRLQILDHLGTAWDLRWKGSPHQRQRSDFVLNDTFPEPVVPTKVQLEWLNEDWSIILKQTQLHQNLLEPFIAFRRVLLQILDRKECMTEHLLQSASILRKGSRLSLAASALHELKLLSCQMDNQAPSDIYFLGRLEEAKILRAQGQNEMAISLAKYILQNYQMGKEASNIYRLVGKWLAETRSTNSRTILEQYLKHSVELSQLDTSTEKCLSRQYQTYFHLAHYTDGLFKSYEERLASSEWQAAMRLRKHKTKELDALIRRLKSSTKGEKTDYSVKIQELQKQLTMDREEAEKLQDDRDNFLSLALEGYQRCLVIGGKYDLQVVFRLVSLWFSLYSNQSVVKAMNSTVKEVQSYKFLPLVYQIASRLGSSKDGQGSISFQKALVSLLRKMAIDHPYHTIFQLLALANGDRIKDKQRSRNSFVVDMEKKLAAENLLNELSSHHGAIMQQMKQMVEIYIKLAELETKKEETNKKMPLPREIRSLRQLELVPVVTASIPVDTDCQYSEGSFPCFKGLGDSIMVMNGINAPKVVECFGSDGRKYRQLAKSGNDDLRQDAVMEQFFGLVNTFLQNHRDTWKRRIRIRTYKVVPFTPSAGVLEWVDRTIPLGEYLLGSTRNGGAHGRYGIGDWSFLQCREYMTKEKDKREAFLKVCKNFRPVMHYFFLERFLQPADWFENRLTYTRSVAASSMVGYIVGLGDRHSMNILIDQTTAEVVHIDLGVAFEQGLMLKTPERVPFRLTRDIIDGMGITGVDGVFRRCCEETLSVMRTNKEALLTIIEVFIHDPLYKWALSPLKALQRQKETYDDTGSSLESSQDAYEGNKDATRATLRVKQKLDGYEEGEMRSVQGQVQQLIQDAVDTDRLCQMFPGWGAWL